MSETGVGGLQQLLDSKPTFPAGAGTVVERRERHLCASSGMHGVQVVDKALHRLIGVPGGMAHGVILHPHDSVGFVIRRKLRIYLLCFLLIALEGQPHAVRHGIVEIHDRLASVLVVLVALNRNRRQCRVAADRFWLAQVTVSGSEATPEQLSQLDLGTGGRPSIEIQVVNVNITLPMQIGSHAIDHCVQIVFLGGVRALLQHRTHGRVAVNVGIVALEVAVLRVGLTDLVKYLSDSGSKFFVVHSCSFLSLLHAQR